jgi:hypothetical protein
MHVPLHGWHSWSLREGLLPLWDQHIGGGRRNFMMVKIELFFSLSFSLNCMHSDYQWQYVEWDRRTMQFYIILGRPKWKISWKLEQLLWTLKCKFSKIVAWRMIISWITLVVHLQKYYQKILHKRRAWVLLDPLYERGDELTSFKRKMKHCTMHENLLA